MAAKTETKRVLIEALAVGVAGALVAVVANAVSPHSFKLSYDYFPSRSATRALTPGTNSTNGVTTNNLSPFQILAAELHAKGLQLADSNQVISLFNDPRREQNLVIFVDARTEDEYQRSHIPGAFLFDNFHREKYLSVVGPACQTAEQIVVYCGGGSCELSQDAALALRDIVQLPKEKLFVYAGGINEWNTNRMPVEAGERLSGKITK